MAKSTITYVCTECGGESLRWAGQCPHCHAWNTLQEFQVKKAKRESNPRPLEPARALPLDEIAPEDAPRQRLQWGELNRVLGGGIVPGSLDLIGGEPGVGKSTLLMHAAGQVARCMDRASCHQDHTSSVTYGRNGANSRNSTERVCSKVARAGRARSSPSVP